VGVRLAGLQRWGAFLARLAGSPRQPEGAGLQIARETERLVEWAARFGPYRGNCLSRSLTLWWLLRRQ